MDLNKISIWSWSAKFKLNLNDTLKLHYLPTNLLQQSTPSPCCLHFTQVKYVITNWYFDNCSFSYNYCVKFSYEILFSIPPPHSIPITRRPAALCALFPGPSSFSTSNTSAAAGAWSLELLSNDITWFCLFKVNTLWMSLRAKRF